MIKLGKREKLPEQYVSGKTLAGIQLNADTEQDRFYGAPFDGVQERMDTFPENQLPAGIIYRDDGALKVDPVS